jgi:hypothetical protein
MVEWFAVEVIIQFSFGLNTGHWSMNTKFMKFNKVHSLQEIANLLKCESIGDKNFEILGMNEIHVVEKVISF